MTAAASVRTPAALDGPVMDVSMGMSHVLTPALRADLNIGWSKERPDREVNRNASRRASAGVTATFRRKDGRTLHVRKATRAEQPQEAIYQALGADPAPGGGSGRWSSEHH